MTPPSRSNQPSAHKNGEAADVNGRSSSSQKRERDSDAESKDDDAPSTPKRRRVDEPSGSNSTASSSSSPSSQLTSRRRVSSSSTPSSGRSHSSQVGRGIRSARPIVRSQAFTERQPSTFGMARVRVDPLSLTTRPLERSYAFSEHDPSTFDLAGIRIGPSSLATHERETTEDSDTEDSSSSSSPKPRSATLHASSSSVSTARTAALPMQSPSHESVEVSTPPADSPSVSTARTAASRNRESRTAPLPLQSRNRRSGERIRVSVPPASSPSASTAPTAASRRRLPSHSRHPVSIGNSPEAGPSSIHSAPATPTRTSRSRNNYRNYSDSSVLSQPVGPNPQAQTVTIEAIARKKRSRAHEIRDDTIADRPSRRRRHAYVPEVSSPFAPPDLATTEGEELSQSQVTQLSSSFSPAEGSESASSHTLSRSHSSEEPSAGRNEVNPTVPTALSAQGRRHVTRRLDPVEELGSRRSMLPSPEMVAARRGRSSAISRASRSPAEGEELNSIGDAPRPTPAEGPQPAKRRRGRDEEPGSSRKSRPRTSPKKKPKKH